MNDVTIVDEFIIAFLAEFGLQSYSDLKTLPIDVPIQVFDYRQAKNEINRALSG